MAREIGAARTVLSTSPAELASIDDAADAVLTFAAADAVTEQAMRALKWGGTLVSGVPLRLDEFPFNKAQTIHASILGNREQMREVLNLAAQRRIWTVTERFPMAEAHTALGLLAQGRLSSRAVLFN